MVQVKQKLAFSCNKPFLEIILDAGFSLALLISTKVVPGTKCAGADDTRKLMQQNFWEILSCAYSPSLTLPTPQLHACTYFFLFIQCILKSQVKLKSKNTFRVKKFIKQSGSMKLLPPVSVQQLHSASKISTNVDSPTALLLLSISVQPISMHLNH